jgi:hypothetical protein
MEHNGNGAGKYDKVNFVNENKTPDQNYDFYWMK